MATTTLDSGATDGLAGVRRHSRAPTSLEGAAGGATVTYCYRTSLGTRGSTTDPDAVPAGAVVQWTVTA